MKRRRLARSGKPFLGPVLPRVVAFGGGHGLAASLSALRRVTDRLTAIVTVADDGGSSGRLRQEFDVLPPGDLRMALSALCDESDWGHTWRDVLQHRFSGDGDLAGVDRAAHPDAGPADRPQSRAPADARSGAACCAPRHHRRNRAAGTLSWPAPAGLCRLPSRRWLALG